MQFVKHFLRGRFKLFQTCDAAKRVLSYETEFRLEVPDLHPLLSPTFSQVSLRCAWTWIMA
jgi:hypothetical protein